MKKDINNRFKKLEERLEKKFDELREDIRRIIYKAIKRSEKHLKKAGISYNEIIKSCR
jgi:vacuolar-type H+-ATPase subunit H